jgi:recombination protein RecR
MLPDPINNLITSIASLPGIGKKGAQKLVLDYLLTSKEVQDNILKSFIDIRRDITICPTCFYLSVNNEECAICKDQSRINNKLMIVQTSFDIISLENTKFYNGKYHVLNKLIAPLDKIMPSDTTIYHLEHRIENYFRKNPTDQLELIYFVKESFQSNTTYAYIYDYINKSKNKDRIKLSKLATGLPTNFNIQTLDQDSLKIAYENRK